MKQLYLLSIIYCASLFAMSSSQDHSFLTDKQKTTILAQLKRDNPSVSPYDTPLQRIERNAKVLCGDPLGFYMNPDRADLLFKYVTERDLILEGEPLNSSLSPYDTETMRTLFEADQREQIKLYRKKKHLPDHPSLPQLYYGIYICGLGGYIDSYTPCWCLALQTVLGCYTT